ncbi:MAG: hypothetical protein GY762_06445, partial [Proteobacteria bacterium]|nr:hypothetical protein [Pseudomonadota bacterium]
MKDSRDGQVYKTVKLGGQTWLAANLNYETENSWCYGDDPANCDVYGRLYDWEAAKTACPSGWHLPTDEDWVTLITYLDPETDLSVTDISQIAGGMIKTTGTIEDETGLWAAPNKGASNITGFSGVPAGTRFEGGNYQVINLHAIFWSATESENSLVWFMTLDYGLLSIYRAEEGEWNMTRGTGLSVRCVNDVVTEVTEPFDPTGSADPDDNSHLPDPTEPDPVFGDMTDSRDATTYDTVTLGDQTWLAENLNYDIANSWCYDDDTDNCDIYGRMYTWQAADEACPAGWHLPTLEEFTALATYLDPATEQPSNEMMDISKFAGGMIKATGTMEDGTGLWGNPNTGATNSSGFSALPAGTRLETGMYTV